LSIHLQYGDHPADDRRLDDERLLIAAVRPGRRPRGGFTLLELLVVVLVLAVIAVVAAPRISTDPALVSTQAAQLAGDIRYVQSLAMTQAQKYRINLSAGGYTFTLADAGGTAVAHPFTGSTAQINWNSGVTVTLPPTNLPNNLVAFDSRGIPYTDGLATTALASTATIVLTKGSDTQQITIVPQTGKVTPP
jgi:prepilin-type N-terminal cleavage/methylation domain-containing protein